MKPIRKERLAKALGKLQSGSVVEVKKQKDEFVVNTFGGLKAQFVDSTGNVTTLKWRTTKTKELFALLIDNMNVELNRSYVIDILWPDFDSKKAYANLNTTTYYLAKSLKSIGAEMLLVKDKTKIGFTHQVSLEFDFKVDFIKFDAIISKGKCNSDECVELFSIYKGPYLGQENYLWSYSRQALMENRLRAFIETKYETIKHNELKKQKIINSCS